MILNVLYLNCRNEIYLTFICIESKQLAALSPIVNKSKLNFSYESLEKATNYFNDSNKLGQGGSGSVYKVCCYLTISSLSR